MITQYASKASARRCVFGGTFTVGIRLNVKSRDAEIEFRGLTGFNCSSKRTLMQQKPILHSEQQRFFSSHCSSIRTLMQQKKTLFFTPELRNSIIGESILRLTLGMEWFDAAAETQNRVVKHRSRRKFAWFLNGMIVKAIVVVEITKMTRIVIIFSRWRISRPPWSFARALPANPVARIRIAPKSRPKDA